jgi:hypothetical protein
MSILSCNPSDADKTVIFDCNRLAIVNGSATEGVLPLTDFVQPIDRFYRADIIVEANSSTVLSFGNVSSEYNEVSLLILIPDYGDIDNSEERLLMWAWASEDPDYVYHSLGSIMMLSGNEVVGVPKIVIGNSQDVDISVKLLIAR